MTKIVAKAKWVRSSPRKIKRVIDAIRGRTPLEALAYLRFMPHKGARILEKVIKSALANAKNNYKLDESSLIIKEMYVNKAIIMKRWQPRARGRAFPIKKRTSHVTVCLEEK